MPVDEPWRCRSCGVVVDAMLGQCWRCGCDPTGRPDAHFPAFDVLDPCCRNCGYSLAGLDQPPCPECGLTFDRFTAAAALGPTDALADAVSGITQPVCPMCQATITPLHHYCPECGECVGQYSACMPLEKIPYYAQFIGRLWRRGWTDVTMRPWKRIAFVLFAVAADWFVLVGLLAGIGWMRRAYRRQHNLCPQCAYDLRGNRDCATCPECGAVIQPESGRSTE